MKKNSTPLTPGSTIYDVASQAGVSITTVSRYLNNPEKVNTETALRVQAAMDRLAYIPHGNTGSKASRQVGRVAVLTPFFPAPSFVQRLQGMTPVFRQAHCEMVIYTIDEPGQLTELLRSMPFAKRFDGLVVMAMRVTDEEASRLAAAGLQVVLVENHHPLFCGVEADNAVGGALAARHLVERGYTSFGFLGDTNDLAYSLHPGDLRLAGYRGALAEAGFSLADRHVLKGEPTVADGLRMGLELLAGPDRPRAVFAMSDLLAIGLLKAARQTGLRVPEDLAVVGFDDIEAADYMELTTVSQALYESGRLAAELLVGRIREPERPLQTAQLKVSVVVRSTT